MFVGTHFASTNGILVIPSPPHCPPIQCMNVYEERREKLLKRLPQSNLLIIGNDFSPINYTDNAYPFRQDSTFLYFTGIKLPGLAIILDSNSQVTTLIGDPSGPDEIIWTGHQTDLKEIAFTAGIHKVISWADFRNISADNVSYLPPYRAKHTQILQSLGISDIKPSSALRDAVISMRQTKTKTEIEHMREAARISSDMHRHVITTAKAGMHEYDLVAEAKHFSCARDLSMAYSPIITKNGHILHNHHYNNLLQEGDLVINDSGVETKRGYCGDITRTFPVSGQFTPLQKDVYNAVLHGYNAAIEMAGPGIRFWDVHFGAALAMVESLIHIGWMKGSAEDAVANGAHALFFPHGLGHMIGMDVHDMENLGEAFVGYAPPHEKSDQFGTKYLRLAKTLEPGFCLTIEPGIYINPHLIARMKKDQKLHEFINFDILEQLDNFGGIRIEDNFVITDTDIDNLDGSLAVEAAAIESMREEALSLNSSAMQ